MCRWILVLFAYLMFANAPAMAERRIALVIGESSYKSVARLVNPANDAAAMAQMFRGAGFDAVVLETDLDAAAMRRALRAFADTAASADMAVVFFAGHGIEIGGAIISSPWMQS